MSQSLYLIDRIIYNVTSLQMVVRKEEDKGWELQKKGVIGKIGVVLLWIVLLVPLIFLSIGLFALYVDGIDQKVFSIIKPTNQQAAKKRKRRKKHHVVVEDPMIDPTVTIWPEQMRWPNVGGKKTWLGDILSFFINYTSPAAHLFTQNDWIIK